MYRPPVSVLPPTGGGVLIGTAGLIAGYILNNWLIVGISLLIIAIIIFCFVRLYLGEKRLENEIKEIKKKINN